MLNGTKNFINIASTKTLECSLSWPVAHHKYEHYTADVFSPIAHHDIKTSSLPIIFVEVNCDVEIKIMFIVNTSSSVCQRRKLEPFLYKSQDHGKTFIEQDNLDALMTGTHFVYAVINWTDEMYASNFYKSAEDLIKQVNYQELKDLAINFHNFLPKVLPENQIYLNMEVFAGIACTKIFKNGEMFTMAYSDFNQRQSFWASFLHLVLFPEVEVKMIEESCQAQFPTGKIPTNLFPLLDREFDIDTTAYFVLRVVRYFRYHKDSDFAKKYHPNAHQAILYLKSLLDDKNVPFARTFWADWKEVRGMRERLYGAHFVLLVKAAVKEFNWMSRELHFEEEFFEVNIEPLWNGEFFADVLKNGQQAIYFHEDQMVPMMWGVVDIERYKSVLAKAESYEKDSPFGLPETQPFYSCAFGYQQGEYHNGGIWPWLSFVDAAVRVSYGFRESAENLLIKVCKNDIDIDLCANQFVNGFNGLNQGFFIQAWNAAAILPFSLLSDEPRNELKQYFEDIKN